MSTTIDSLQIEIQTGSSNAAGGIDKLAASLERLKKVGSFNVVIKNLNNLSSALDKLQNSSSGLVKLNLLASSIESLKKAGSFGSISTSFTKLGTALKDLESINIDGVVAKIKELNDKVGPVSQKLVAIGNAFKVVNSKAIQTSGGFSVFGGKVNTTTLNLQSMISVAKSVASALKSIVNLLKKTIGEAIEWEGIAQRFGRGFGDQAEEVYSWVQRLNKEMGINTQQFMQYSSTYATMLAGFGVASKDASNMALGYMELTYDIWAGYNDIYKSLDDAATAVRSAIAGEVEPVRKAGFTIIESTLEQTAANHGLKISLEKATEAQKSYLRYLTLVDQANAQGLVGNYAREMNTAEGVMRTFNQQLKSLGQTFGSIFLPVLVKVMPWLQAFIDLIGDAIMAVANFFGVDIQKMDFGSSGFKDMGASANGANEEIKKTEQSLKDLKNATTGIDELNIISPQSGSGGSSTDTGSGFDGVDVGSLWDESIFVQIQRDVDGVKEKLKDWLPIIGSIGLGIAAWKLTDTFITGVAALKTLVATPSYSIAIALTIVGVSLFADGVKKAIEEGLDGISFAEIIGGGLFSTGGIALLGSKIATWISTAFAGSAVDLAITQAGINLGVGTAGGAGAALAGAAGAVIAGLTAFFVGVWDSVVNGIDWWSSILTAIGGAAAGAGVAAILTAVGTAVAPGVGTAIGLAVGLVVDGIILAVQEWDAISDFFSTLFTETIPRLWNDFKTWLSKTIEDIKSKVSNAWSTAKKWWNDNVSLKVAPVVSSIKDKLSSAWTTAKKWWNDNVSLKVAPVVSSIKDKLSSAWTTAKKWWNDNVKLSIPSLSFKVTYSTAGLNAVQKSIVKVLGLQGWPKLSFAANGGIFDTGSLVWAGEAGPEIVANAGGGKTGVMNVQQMSEAVYEGVYSAVVAAMRASGGNGGSQSVNVYLDGKQITGAVEQRQKERGASIMGNQVYSY